MNKKIQQFLFFRRSRCQHRLRPVDKVSGSRKIKRKAAVCNLGWCLNRITRKPRGCIWNDAGQTGIFLLIAIAVIAVVVFLLFRMPSDKKYLPFTGCLFLLVPAPQAI